jgi:hypothetical protein
MGWGLEIMVFVAFACALGAVYDAARLRCRVEALETRLMAVEHETGGVSYAAYRDAARRVH